MNEQEHISAAKKRERIQKCEAFLAALALCGVVSQAAKLAKVNRTSMQKLKKKSPEFAARWRQAMREAADTLVEEARRRALFEGSDTLLIFLLKGERPKKYRDNWKGEISTPRDQPLQIEQKVSRDDLSRIYDQLQAAQGHLPGPNRVNGHQQPVDTP